MDRTLYRDIKTGDWHTIDHLGMPATNVSFVYVDRETPEPAGARDVRYEAGVTSFRKGRLPWNRPIQEKRMKSGLMRRQEKMLFLRGGSQTGKKCGLERL